MNEAVASITETDFLNKLSVIADDSMLGRADPSPGLDMTAQWVADQFRSYGLKPGGDDGTFIQHYTMQQMAPDFDASSASIAGGPELEFGSDLSYRGGAADAEATGPVVIVAGDLASAEEFPVAQVQGKHVVLILAQPDAGQARRRRMRMPAGLMDAQPASMIFLDRSSDEDWATQVERAREQTQTLAPWDEPAAYSTLAIRESSLAPVLSSHGMDLAALERASDQQGGLIVREVPDLELSLTTATREAGSFSLPNTVGILEGSDPELKNEYVLFSAHMDHIGVRAPNEAGDSINNGADDDGSGTISVVEVAEAFSMLAQKPARSVIFLTVSGEERGLWGSRYYSENPSVPIEQIVADLNSDMISRNATDTIVAIGKEHSDLGETLARVNEAHPELNLTAIDDIWPEQNFYRRSDHFNFARRGVPILFFFCGTTEDYHQPSDEISKVDELKATNTSKLLFYLGLEIANNPERPQWNPESYAEIVDGGGEGL